MEITYDDFSKVDIRIGTIIKAEVPEWSHWVMKLTVDFGEELGKRVIFSGIMKFYKVEDLEKKQFPFVVNLKPKKIGPEGDFSNGMLMAVAVEDESASNASQSDAGGESKPVLFQINEKVKNGSRVV